MLGLDAAGKTTILYKLHIGEVLSTVPTIGMLLIMRDHFRFIAGLGCCAGHFVALILVDYSFRVSGLLGVWATACCCVSFLSVKCVCPLHLPCI